METKAASQFAKCGQDLPLFSWRANEPSFASSFHLIFFVSLQMKDRIRVTSRVVMPGCQNKEHRCEAEDFLIQVRVLALAQSHERNLLSNHYYMTADKRQR
jgi:hypothetical protein